jgi:anti-repressor protein
MTELDLFATAGDGLESSHFGLADDGTAYVEAPAFARTLSYSSTQAALKQVEDEEWGYAERLTPGGPQRMKVIYEDGIWELIFRSTLLSAKAIKTRVKAILRELRETGVVDTREKPLTELEVARRYVAALERVAELEPAAHSWNTLADADGDYSVSDAAKILARDPTIEIGRDRLFRYLASARWIFRTGAGRWAAYQNQIDNGRMAELPQSHPHPETGERVLDPPQVRVTVKGLHELHKRMGGSGPLLLAA